jgi:hypothetical protein
MNKFAAALQALQQGKQLADAVRAKNWQVAFNVGGLLLLSLLNFAPLFGVPIPTFLLDFITPETVNKVGFVIGGLFNGYMTVATSEKVGLPAAPVVEDPRS